MKYSKSDHSEAMDDLRTQCCICLSLSEDTKKVGSSCSKNESLLFKLQNVVPEVGWSNDYSVCRRCTAKVNIAYKFRTLCMQRNFERKPAFSAEIIIVKGLQDEENFTDKQVLNEHSYAHCDQIQESEVTAAKKFQCNSCKKTYSMERTLKTHLKKCNPSQIRKKYSFSCEVCNLELKKVKLLIEHCITEHSMERKLVKPYSCDACPKRFTSSTILMQHSRRLHDRNRSYICSFCSKAFITTSDLKSHERSHLNHRNYKCEFCSKAFNTSKSLGSHTLVVHTDSSLWKFSCAKCSRRFPNKTVYNQHMQRHAGDKHFVCHICNKSFVTRGELQRHVEYHSAAKPFKCDHCKREYKSKWEYKIHLTKAHGIGNTRIPVRARKFACDLCPSRFPDRPKLEKHKRSHSGLKPYLCELCYKKFADKYYLKYHRGHVHSVNDEDDPDSK